MGETFYGVLGVADDADTDAIRRAYRERVKTAHPDVTDDPGATRTFKRVTTARDVLTDEAERALYDHLGHDLYVGRHLQSDLWDAGDGSSRIGCHPDQAPPSNDPDGVGRRGTAWTRSTNGEAQTGRGWEGGRTHRQRGRPRHGVTADSWQTASAAYRRTPRPASNDGSSRLATLKTAIGALGPWLAIHVAFIGSAIATGWFTLAQPDRVFELTVPAVTIGVLMVLMVVGLSTLHVVSLLYA